jgi:hypothetical protein
MFYLLMLSIFLSPSWAQGYKSFFTSFDPTVNVSKSEIKEAIRDHFKQGGTYLALGETHLENESVHNLQKEFVDVFLEVKGQRDFTFCSETIADWLTSPAGDELQKSAKVFTQFSGASFNKCQNNQTSLYFNYAGDFHLFPYARGFTLEFKANPVLDRDDLNMQAQMKGEKGLFIPQFELVYIEGQASASLINEGLSPVAFRLKAQKHLEQSQKIRTAMKEVLPGDTHFSNKMGIFIPKSGFDSNVHMPKTEQLFFFLTNRTYRDMHYAHHLVKKILRFDDVTLGKLLKAVIEKKGYFLSFFFTRDNIGTEMRTSYGSLPNQVDGESQVIDFGNMKILSQPLSTELECFVTKEVIKFSPNNCLDVINSVL